MTLEEMQQWLREMVDEGAVALDLKDGGGFGVVLWYRPFSPDVTEHIVHRWATVYTDGSPVNGGCMFYAGSYFIDRKAEAMEFYDQAVAR
jgi:hypothetical protein